MDWYSDMTTEQLENALTSLCIQRDELIDELTDTENEIEEIEDELKYRYEK